MKTVVSFINSSRKAIVAFAVTFAVGYIARKGYSLDANGQEVLRALLDGAIGGVLVWLTANKQ